MEIFYGSATLNTTPLNTMTLNTGHLIPKTLSSTPINPDDI